MEHTGNAPVIESSANKIASTLLLLITVITHKLEKGTVNSTKIIQLA